ncbi:MAG: SGNH/GDSL hydrolase family protein [Gallionella sp.]
MRQFKLILALLMVLFLVSCGGSGSAGNQSPKISFSSQVVFGDSLSDVGTYKVGTVAALGGGEYTINGAGKNWTELMAAQLGLPAPCAAQTGLAGSAVLGFNVPVVNHAGCTGYAQGGARVTNPIGPGNAALGAPYSTLGELTVPVVTQINNHLAASGGSFKGNEIVFVMAGGNDVFIQLASVSAGLPAASAVVAMGTAASELVADINTLILAKGAKYVTVVNIPDVSITPFAAALGAPTQGLIATMTNAFNSQLQSGLAGNPNVLLVDAFTASHDEFVNPAPYGLTNVTTPACNLTSPSPNALGSSLVCNSTNLIPGVVTNYLFADDVHPTPFGYLLLARYVSRSMIIKGWL